MGSYKGAAKGAVGGAAAGSAFGPWGTAIGGGLGGLLGYFTDDTSAANGKKQDAFDQNVSDLGGLSNSMDARRKAALSQSLAMFGPTDSLLSRMYGPGAVGPGIDIDALFGPDMPMPTGGTPASPPKPYTYFDPPEVQRRIETNLTRSGLNKNDTFKRGTRGKRTTPRGYGA